MRRDCIRPVSFTFSALFKACGAKLDVELGRQIHAQTFFIGGYESDLFVGNTLIDMYVKCGFLDCGRCVFDEMPERDVISWTSLIVAYAKNGDMEVAGELFEGLPEKDMVAWTAMITGYVQNAKPKEALKMFEMMRDAGVRTDEVALVGGISACAQLVAEKHAQWICDIADKEGLSPVTNVVVGSAFIDMYSKCGRVEEAYRVFESMKVKNVFSYSSMIVGFAMHGKADAAMKLFYEMVETETKPNRVTFVGVLTACSHAGMVQQGRCLFASMQKDYGVVPDADHHACMVDLLGRAGHLEEALELVETMPLEPHGGVWGALLGACRLHGNPDIAEIAAKHLFELEPNSIGNYILLSNIYALAGRMEDVSRIRKLVRGKGMKKNPGCSWVEAKDGNIHEFYAGEMTHPKSKEIKKALEKLLDTLKREGYKPNLSSIVYDISDGEKEQVLKTHSEKLALSFGLLTTTAGSPIKIVKNLRVCEDCHLVMCGASRITKREIVLRDNMRFHHFRDGVCSCVSTEMAMGIWDDGILLPLIPYP
ncbi:Pentatricopeptide repeat-containing protein [Thalictrum thalictroides]|uniref:Pentatricopeptide repeat-containing protein n=1 Tax=Thalictrum thalictroides TaxID=46969 RepID=A0A7J6VDQ8_THATH|nr:Pentatricopeptide repeat-containing protein [Thalictrum thalictroides]